MGRERRLLVGRIVGRERVRTRPNRTKERAEGPRRLSGSDCFARESRKRNLCLLFSHSFCWRGGVGVRL
jgi:hypothetical protein